MSEHEKAIGKFVTDAYEWYENLQNKEEKTPQEMEVLFNIHSDQRRIILKAFAGSTKQLDI